MKKEIVAIALMLGIASISCEKTEVSAPETENNDSTAVKEVVWKYDLAADSGSTGNYVYFSFNTNEVVPSTDSNSSKWDMAFKSTSIIFNGGVSGPAQVSAQMITGNFSDVLTAPEDNYAFDTEETYAIPNGSGEGWYNYNFEKHIIQPIPGKIMVVKISETEIYKLEIISFYKGNPAQPDNAKDVARFYTFRFQQL